MSSLQTSALLSQSLLWLSHRACYRTKPAMKMYSEKMSHSLIRDSYQTFQLQTRNSQNINSLLIFLWKSYLLSVPSMILKKYRTSISDLTDVLSLYYSVTWTPASPAGGSWWQWQQSNVQTEFSMKFFLQFPLPIRANSKVQNFAWHSNFLNIKETS